MGAAAAVVVLTTASLTLTGSSASAAGPQVVPGLAADPYVITCEDAGRVAGLCLYTASDTGVASGDGNPYPMENTRVFFSSDGGRTWSDRGTAMSESWFGKSGFRRLEAPAASVHYDWGGAHYVLYEPDVLDRNDPHGSARVFAFRSDNDPFGGFRNQPGTVVSGFDRYMAEPEVFNDFGTQDMVFGNADADDCGGVSIARMPTETSVDSVRKIVISGLSALGGCTATGKGKVAAGTTFSEPSLDGPQMLDLTQLHVQPPTGALPGEYLLYFAAKPVTSPPECAVKYGNGGTANEVLAYATADSLAPGPDGNTHFTYRGILMCGSDHEWTNQGDLIETQASNGSWRLQLLYHDGPSGQPKRTLRSECLFAVDGKFIVAQRSTDGTAWCLGTAHQIFALQSTSTGAIVSADGSSGVLTASRDRVSTWEEFSSDLGSTLTIHARATQKFVSWSGGNLTASSSTAGANQTFTRVDNADGTISLRTSNQQLVSVNASSKNLTLTGSAALAAHFRLIVLSG